MSFQKFVRQSHRWVCIAFTVATIAAFVGMSRPEPIVWVSYLPLPPLFFLLASGLYLFALPYTKKGRTPALEQGTAS